MSDTNLTQHPDNVHVGPASLCLYNEATDHLVIVGKVDDLIFERQDPTNEFLSEIINKQTVRTAGMPTFCGFTLRGKFCETRDPNTIRLFMKNCGTPTVEDDCTIGTYVEDYTVFPDRCVKLKHNVGFYGIGALPAPAGVTGSSFAGSGTVPAGTYTFVVTCLYGVTEGSYAVSNAITVGASDIVLEITPPAGIIPDFYKIYVYDDTQVRADATLVQTTPATNLHFDSLDFGGDAYPGDATSSFTIVDSAGTPFTVINDFTVDTSCAIICFEPTGDIEEGELVTVTYTSRVNPYVEMSIGPSDVLPPYVRPVILAFEKDDRAITRPRGIEIELWKVLASSGWSWDLSSLNFQSGFEFTWEVLCSEKTLNHGQVTTFNRHYAAYSLVEWAGMTDWHNGPGCADESV